MKTKTVTLLSFYVLILCFILQYSPCVKVQAITCDITQLSPCAEPIMYGSATPPACCSSLKKQQPCLCQYARNPVYAGYVYGSNSRRVASDCHVSLPRCWVEREAFELCMEKLRSWGFCFRSDQSSILPVCIVVCLMLSVNYCCVVSYVACVMWDSTKIKWLIEGSINWSLRFRCISSFQIQCWTWCLSCYV